MLEVTIDELNDIIGKYNKAFAHLTNIKFAPRWTAYPDGLSFRGRPAFTGFGASIRREKNSLTEEIWFDRGLLGRGTLTPDEVSLSGGRSVAFPRDELVNLRALCSHEAGHCLRNFYSTIGTDFRDNVDKIVGGYINQQRGFLNRLTPDTFRDYDPEFYPSEIFAELFAASTVLDDYDTGLIGRDLVPDALLNMNPSERRFMTEFDDWLETLPG